MAIFDLNWGLIGYNILHLLAAFLLAIPLGWDRERSSRNFGFRTFPLVAMVSCGFMMVGISVGESADAEARIMQGIITGIGFIGGGAILTSEEKIKGTATATTIWNTGAIGVAVAHGRFEVAIVLSALNFFTLLVFKSIKEYAVDSKEEGDG